MSDVVVATPRMLSDVVNTTPLGGPPPSLGDAGSSVPQSDETKAQWR